MSQPDQDKLKNINQDLDSKDNDTKQSRGGVSHGDSTSQVNEIGAHRTTGTSMKSTSNCKCFKLEIKMNLYF
jgi:hypothetical protein